MIKKEVSLHPLAYLVLVIGTIFFILGFFNVWPDRATERLVVAAYAVFYFLWGVLTHHSKQQATISLIKEYAVVSILGALLLLMLTF